jgi:hypothetical protein
LIRRGWGWLLLRIGRDGTLERRPGGSLKDLNLARRQLFSLAQ